MGWLVARWLVFKLVGIPTGVAGTGVGVVVDMRSEQHDAEVTD